MKVRSRIYLSSLLMVALISTMVVCLFIFSMKINRELEREAAVDEVVKGFIRLVLVADDFMAYPYERKSRQWNAQYEKMAELLKSDAETGTYEELISRFRLLNKLFEKLRIEMAKNPEGVVIERVMGRIRWVSHDLINHGYQIIAEKNQRVASLQRKSNLLLFSISILLVLVSVLTSLIIIKSIVVPLKNLTKDVHQIREGNFALIEKEDGIEKGENEFGALSRAFYAMAARLARTINDLRSSESALLTSEQLLNNAIDSAPIGMVLVKPDGYFFRINRAFCSITGYSEEELSQKTFQDITHPDDHEIGTEAVRELLDEKTTSAALQKRYVHKDGRTVHMQLTTTLLKDLKGNPLYFFTQALDVTKRKEEAEAFRINQELLNQALEGAGAGVWKMNLETNDLFLDDRFLEMMGYRKEDLQASLQENLHHPDDWDAVMARLEAHLKGRTPIYISEHRALSKSGEWRWLHARAKVVEWNETGKPLKLVGTAHDITEQKQAEEELKQHRDHLEELVKNRTRDLEEKTKHIEETRQALTYLLEDVNESRAGLEVANNALARANDELKDFAHIVSHDLKAPLRAVSQLSYWISEDYGDKLGDEGKKQISLLINRVQRMDGLIDGILQYSRVGRIRDKKETLDLNALVREVIDALAPPEQVKISVKGNLPTIVCDRTRMEQVFQNLLSNAIKFMDKPEGIIEVSCHEHESSRQFSVKDNGPGIDSKYHDRIFKIFQTLSARDERESTGIGLSLVKKIVELYSGKVWVESEPGKGSTFFFTIPKN